MGKKYAVRGELSEERRAKIRESLLRAAGDEKTTLVSEQDVLHLVGAKPHEFGAVLQQLDQLEAEGALVRNKKGRYLLPETYDLFAGTLRGHRRGFAFVSLDNGSQDVYIPRSSVGNAIDGDRVLIRLFSETHGDHRTGSVEKILSRGVTFVTGTYAPERSFGFVITDGKFLPDVYVPQEDAMGARRGDKVKVRITKYPDEVSGLRGEVTEIFGAAGDSRAETEAVIARYDVRTEFPESVCGEAAGAPQKVTKKDRQGREDLREKTLITIDGADARDFDDAVRVERKENGSYLLYVCIADVAEYVTEGSPLDKEALARGCSVYFPNRVCPMLPAELSNGICSLNEGEDRLTLTAEMEISEAGEVVTYRIYESVIRSAARMIYTDVSDILEESDLSESADFSESAGDSDGPEDGNAVQKRAEVREKRDAKESLKEKYRDLLPMLYDMRDLSEILARKRYREGSIDFDVAETQILVDEEGDVVSLEPAERRTANKIIEEFMLTANKVVAEHCFWMEIPFLYRVHEKPDQMKMEQLKHFAATLGFTLKGSCSNIHPKAVRDLLLQAEGSDSERVIGKVALRSMKKAVYDTECGGHFGLGFRYYCHFTSPIRRYPDLMVHRVIKETLHGALSDRRYRRLEKLMKEAAEISSVRERVAVDAERAVEKKLRAVYMSRFVGEKFEGIISSVVSAGFFVELKNTAEGYVPAETLLDDYYIFDEKNYRMVGERHRRIFAIGDRVVIRVDKVNTITDEIDFHLVTDDEEHGELQRKKSGPRRRKNDVAERSSLSEKRSRRSKRRRKNSGKKKERSIGEVLPADASAGESGKENGNSLAGKTGEKSGGSPRKNGRGYAKKRRSR